MTTPSHTPIRTIPFTISSSGNNVVVPLFVPATGLFLARTYISTIKFFPDAAATCVIKAVNTLTASERILDAGSALVAGQAFIMENTSPDSVYLWELLPNEELVIELDSAVTCTGFTNVSYGI